MSEVYTYLEHYGTKGMRWGVRKSRSSSDSDSSPASKTKHLTNDELRKVIDRMRLDQQYAELSNPKRHSGKQYASKLVKDSGSKLIGAVVGTVATIAVTQALGQQVAKSEAAKEIAKEGYKKVLQNG